MEDEAVGIEALWTRIAAAQSGWYFLLKWMVVAGTAQVAGTGLRMMTSGWTVAPAMKVSWTSAILISVAVSAISDGARGWLIFGGRWRLPAWIAVSFPVLFLWFARHPSVYIRHYFLFYLLAELIKAVGELLLLCGVRHRPVWWLMARMVTNGIMVGSLAGLNGAIITVPAWTQSLSIPPWLNIFSLINSAEASLNLAILGATLAWLMPPVVPVEPPRDPQ